MLFLKLNLALLLLSILHPVLGAPGDTLPIRVVREGKNKQGIYLKDAVEDEDENTERPKLLIENHETRLQKTCTGVYQFKDGKSSSSCEGCKKLSLILIVIAAVHSVETIQSRMSDNDVRKVWQRHTLGDEIIKLQKTYPVL
jgi:hypothetical protein